MIADYVRRLAWVGARGMLSPKVTPLEESRIPMRVWLSDIDVNGHINNGRYLTLMDFARFDHAIRSGMMREFVKRGWWPIAGASTVFYRRELRLGASFELVSRVGAWDEKWMFIEHRFEKDGVVHAIGYLKVVVRKGKEPIPPAECMRAIGYDGPSPEPTPELRAWMEAQKRK